jgi:hypothetical protein
LILGIPYNGLQTKLICAHNSELARSKDENTRLLKELTDLHKARTVKAPTPQRTAPLQLRVGERQGCLAQTDQP